MERKAINNIIILQGVRSNFTIFRSFFHQKSHCFLTLEILFCVVHSQSAVCINFTLPFLQWTLPDKPVICNQANIDPFNICSNNVQAKACYWWHTIFICFLHTKHNKKTVSETSTSLLYQNTRFPPTRIWNQESTSSVTQVSQMWSLILVFLSASCSWKKNFIQLLNWLISKWFYILVQVQITETPQKLAVLNQIVESLHKFQDVTSKILEALF